MWKKVFLIFILNLTVVLNDRIFPPLTVTDSRSRIVGGKMAKKEQFPYQVRCCFLQQITGATTELPPSHYIAMK